MFTRAMATSRIEEHGPLSLSANDADRPGVRNGGCQLQLVTLIGSWIPARLRPAPQTLELGIDLPVEGLHGRRGPAQVEPETGAYGLGAAVPHARDTSPPLFPAGREARFGPPAPTALARCKVAGALGVGKQRQAVVLTHAADWAGLQNGVAVREANTAGMKDFTAMRLCIDIGSKGAQSRGGSGHEVQKRGVNRPRTAGGNARHADLLLLPTACDVRFHPGSPAAFARKVVAHLTCMFGTLR
mmetsp:Transcript_99117/g.275992  ORF Transcript_99117/g.275992 Transcript_99117/m.275992 type:complete len:243 (+) Transcript_99117:436-1164(+)